MLLLLAASPARAKDKEMGLTLGQAIILGSEADRMTDGLSFNLFYLRRRGLWLSAGMELGQTLATFLKGSLSTQELGDLDSPPDGIPDSLKFTSKVKNTVLWLTPCLRLGREDDEAVTDLRPYGILGAGLYVVSNPAGKATLSGMTTGGLDTNGMTAVIKKKVANDFGVNFGGGFTLKVSGSFEMGGDLRFHYVLTRPGGVLQFLYPGARFTFFF